jgi:RNA 2',3'-cyclic 3'-phosphodiesterase
MRLFIAIRPPEEIIGLASMIGKGLTGFPLRFVKPENMDITLAFLGEIDDKDLGSVRERLMSIRFGKLALKTKGYGFFPSEKRIRVIWIGLERNEDFFRLQHDIRKLFGHKEKFMPHITIARAKEIIINDAERLNDTLKKIGYDEIEFDIDRFYLFSSELTPEGPIHKVIEEYSAD